MILRFDTAWADCRRSQLSARNPQATFKVGDFIPNEYAETYLVDNKAEVADKHQQSAYAEFLVRRKNIR